VTDSPEDMAGLESTPAEKHLVPVNNQKPIQLNMKKKDLFHHFISLQSNGFLSKHSRLDIQTAVEFFTTWVTKPDEDDYKKLAREIRYLR